MAGTLGGPSDEELSPLDVHFVRAVARLGTALAPEPRRHPARAPSPYRLDAAHDGHAYAAWLVAQADDREEQRAENIKRLGTCESSVRLSFLIPVGTSDEPRLRATVASLR